MARVQWIVESAAPGSPGVGGDPFAWLGVTLPSEESAKKFVSGERGGLLDLALHYVGRSAIIGTGLFLAGARGADVVKYAAVSAGAIEAVILAEVLLRDEVLPTGDNATDVVRGKPGAIPGALAMSLVRGLIIGAGLALFGVRGSELVKYSLAGSAAVEAFVLSYAALEERKR